MRLDIRNIENTARQLESRNRSLETQVQEKEMNISRCEADMRHLQEKIDNMENIHKKELETQKERVNHFCNIKYQNDNISIGIKNCESLECYGRSLVIELKKQQTESA